MDKKNKKVLIIVAVSIIVLGVISYYIAREEQEKEISSSYAQEEKTESLEYKLATIEKGYVSRDDIIIRRFRSLLSQLSSSYVENKQQIADMTVKAQEILREEEGIKESLLNMMEGMNQILFQKVENQKYSEYMAAYMALRRKGQSHNEAIYGLKGIVETLIK
ncbi:MAG: hypothetical protein ACOC5T_00665 [Elusimicrobiota bacterium]